MSDLIARSAQDIPSTGHVESHFANVLPVEILGYIFMLAASQVVDEIRERDYKWLKYTHVCRYWRQAAVHNGLLWNKIYIPMYSLPEVEMYLQNSRTASLTVNINDDSGAVGNALEEHKQSIDKIFQHLNRIQVLNLGGCDLPVWEQWQVVLRTGTTSLVELTLDNSFYGFLHISEDLFGEFMPPLKKLTLKNFCALPAWPALSSLTTLVMDWGNALENPEIDLRNMLDALEACQSLEQLGIRLGKDWELSERRPIRLPRLSALKLGGDAKSYLEIIPELILNLALPEDAAYIAVVATVRNSNEMEVSVHPIIRTPSRAIFQIEFQSDYDGDLFPHDVQIACLAVAIDAWFRNTVTLEFYLPYIQETIDICGASWSDLFDKVPDLRHFVYGGNPWETGVPIKARNIEMIEALAGLHSLELRGNFSTQNVQSKCRRLGTISFQRLDFGDSSFIHDLTAIRAFETRRRKGKIQFKQCVGLNEEDLGSLRSYTRVALA